MPSEAQIRCPMCKHGDVRAHGRRYALYPYALVAIFNLILVSLHYLSLPYDYTCRKCGFAFRRRSRTARICLWLLLGALLLSGLAAMCIGVLIVGLEQP